MNICHGEKHYTFYHFFNTRIKYLTHIVPNFHPLGEVFIRWNSFLSLFEELFDAFQENASSENSKQCLRRYYVKIYAGIAAYTEYIESVKEEDRNRKSDKAYKSRKEHNRIDDLYIEDNSEEDDVYP